MAFSNTVIHAGVNPQTGLVFEEGTWNGASVTTGTITPGSGTNFPSNTPKITKITVGPCVTNDISTNTVTYSLGGVFQTLVLDAFTSSDTGKYFIQGEGA